jgi:glyoxylase-like metal-dependent hydrolase (beta-lactamase superfamily II)
MKTRTFGDVRVDTVVEHVGTFADPLEMYADATREAIDSHRHWMEPDHYHGESGLCIMAFQSYLIRTPHHTILVDSCVGEDKERARPSWNHAKWPWMDNLNGLGVRAEDIDFVMCTHLHPDHIGWNTQLLDGRWVQTFPNARYLFSAGEYAHWEAEMKAGNPRGGAFEDSVLPVMEAGSVDLVSDDFEIEQGLYFEPTPGHTPHHVALRLDAGGDHGVFCGDLMHHPLQVPERQWSTMFCSDPDMSRVTRTKFVEDSADQDVIVMPAHFAGESAGRVVDRGGTLMFDFLD